MEMLEIQLPVSLTAISMSAPNPKTSKVICKSDFSFFQEPVNVCVLWVIELWNVVGVGLAAAGFFGLRTKRPLLLFVHFALLVIFMLLIEKFSKFISSRVHKEHVLYVLLISCI